MAEIDDDEIRAIQAVISALTPLNEDARTRVLDYAFKRLGVTTDFGLPSEQGTAEVQPATPIPVEVPTSPAGVVRDIRSLRDEKQPKSANEMAALVAYYLSELAPPEERKEAITTADIQQYFKQAGQRLPQAPGQTVKNAAAAGYLDSAERGAYKLNPVGYNLVAHTLPRSGATTTRGSTAKKRRATASKRKTARATTARSRGPQKGGGRKTARKRKG